MKRIMLFTLIALLFIFASCSTKSDENVNEITTSAQVVDEDPTDALENPTTDQVTTTEKESEDDTVSGGGGGIVVVSYIVDIKDNSDTATDLRDEPEIFYQDDDYSYYFDKTPASEHISVIFSDGSTMNFKDAFDFGYIGIEHLDLFGIKYEREYRKEFVTSYASAGHVDGELIKQGADNAQKLEVETDHLALFKLDKYEDMVNFKTKYNEGDTFKYGYKDLEPFIYQYQEFSKTTFDEKTLFIIYIETQGTKNYYIDSVTYHERSMTFNIDYSQGKDPSGSYYVGMFLLVEVPDEIARIYNTFDAKLISDTPDEEPPTDEIPEIDSVDISALFVEITHAGLHQTKPTEPDSLNYEKYLNSPNTLPVFKFDTRDELKAFKVKFGSDGEFDHGYKNMTPFGAGYSRCANTDFFEENILILIQIRCIGSIGYYLDGIYNDDGVITFNVCSDGSEESFGGDVFMFVHIPREYIGYYTSFDAKLIDFNDESMEG